jgi:NDP-sugar pyrophosphorylase family protein
MRDLRRVMRSSGATPGAARHGLIHEGDWLHIGTPETLTAAQSWFAAREAQAWKEPA